jgi:hypothetical protein
MIHPHDHEPANVHVRCGNGVAKVNLQPAVELVRIDGYMSLKDARRAVELVTKNRDMLLQKWREIHGDQ